MKKILIIQTASIGDVILATALVETLHRTYSSDLLDLLVKKGNESLFIGHPFLHEVIIWDKKSGKYANFMLILGKIRTTKYDIVVNIQRFLSTGLLTALSGAGETRGFSKNPVSFFFSKRVAHPIGSGIHEVIRNQALIGELAFQDKPMPRLYHSASDESAVDVLVKGKYYTLSPASLWYTKQYPVEKWVALIRKIPQDVKVYLLGAPNDQQLCDDIISKAGHGNAFSLAGRLSFLQSAALMKKAWMNFTNDSAPMHLASAVNAPVTAIYCSTIPEFGFGPLADNSAVVETEEKLVCRPCGLHGFNACPEKHFRCALEINEMKLIRRL